MRRRQVVRYLALAGGTAVSLTTAGCSDAGNGTSQAPSEASPTKSEDRSTPAPAKDGDGDGFTVCEERQLLEGSEVGRRDIYVEVDWTEGYRPDPAELNRVKDVYETAPVEASQGANPGMNLHITYGETVPAQSEPFGLTDLRDYRSEYFENAGRGYHYALFVEEVEPPAFGREDDGHVLVQSRLSDSERSTTQVFAHELGHALGLTRDVFEGVDSARTHSFEEYPSVMNYDGRDGYLDFSEGNNSEADFDDWGYLEENLSVPGTGALETTDDC